MKTPVKSGQKRLKNHLLGTDKVDIGTEKEVPDVVIVNQHNPDEKSHEIWLNVNEFAKTLVAIGTENFYSTNYEPKILK